MHRQALARLTAAHASAGPVVSALRAGGRLIIGFIAIHQWQQQQAPERISDLAAMDSPC